MCIRGFHRLGYEVGFARVSWMQKVGGEDALIDYSGIL